MKTTKTKLLIVFCISVLVLLNNQKLYGQKTSKNINSQSQKAELIDTFQRDLITSEEADARIDNFSNELSKNSHAKGFIIFYCGKICQYGQIEAHLRGIEATLAYKKLDLKKFVLIAGGFREQFTTEFWLVRDGDCTPIPTQTINISKVKVKGA
ncbi:MAG: hypothetical protein ABR566_18055, partial [Pyrinomonadaceae bacterium]